MSELHRIAQQMVATPRGILAADESTGTCERRFQELNIACNEETRRQYRQMLFTTEDLGEYISGIILFNETLFQNTDDGTPFVDVMKEEGILPGIKVDEGLEKQPNGEELTKGLDGLAENLKKYKHAGAVFAKWRAVIHITHDLPTKENIEESAKRLAQYAKTCQEHGIVPIVEPEVLMDGDHTIERCAHVTTETLTQVFRALKHAHVDLRGMILKPNMIVPGKKHAKASVDQVADETVKVLLACVPPEVPGIAFLSGGIGDEECTAYLAAMNKRHRDAPWKLTFSFGRGLQRPALAAFAKEKLKEGQAALLARAKEASDATLGR